MSPDNTSGSSGKSISEHNADSGHPDSPDDDGLGPLPPNWEKSFTDKGEPYFIDHNTGEIRHGDMEWSDMSMEWSGSRLCLNIQCRVVSIVDSKYKWVVIKAGLELS